VIELLAGVAFAELIMLGVGLVARCHARRVWTSSLRGNVAPYNDEGRDNGERTRGSVTEGLVVDLSGGGTWYPDD
jgi:hypothetical protein